MPKRLVDGEGVWGSRTLKNVEPPWMRAEYTNLLPLALADGVFECDPELVWSRVYSFNRPDIKPTDVAAILEEFWRKGLLFTYVQNGKTWGLWVGIQKAGRLPPASRIKNNEFQTSCTEIPVEALTQYVRDTSAGLGLVRVRVGKVEGEQEPAAAPPSPLTHPLFEIWQEEHGQLPPLRGFNPDRLRKCRARMVIHASNPERFLADFRAAVRKATQNAFLTGTNNRGWKATFDWFIANDTNYLKALEGNYDGGGNGAGSGKQRVADETDQKALRQLREDAERRRTRGLQ